MYKFFNDEVSDIDYLGYYPYIEAFNYLLVNNSELISPPLVFGIHGKWGTGKSTFMNLIKNKLDTNFYTIEVNPWEYGEDQNFVTIFLANLYDKVKKEVFLKGDKSASEFLKAIFKPLKLSLDLKPVVKLEYDFNKFSLNEQENVIESFISENFAMKKSINYILNHNFFDERKIVVFIDDLDRCSVDKVMEVIESIKLIFNSKNCIFFMGCDTNYIESALSIKYEKFMKFIKEENRGYIDFDFKVFSREYLEKIIQIPFYIPSISEESVKGYIESILNTKLKHKIEESKKNSKLEKNDEKIYEKFKNDLKDQFISELIIKADLNPRRIKRILNLIFLNYLFMKFKNKEQTKFEIDTKLLALLCIIREVYPNYYKMKLSYEQSCKDIFKEMFNAYDKEIFQNDSEDIQTYIKEGSIYEQKVGANILESEEEAIYELFKIYFEFKKIGKLDVLINNIKDIILYISVNNMNMIDNYNELEWGELSKIKSDITGKSLKTFLQVIHNNSAAKSIIYWFFNDLYLKDKEKYILGIVKNVNIYSKKTYKSHDLHKSLIFRFEFNKQTEVMYILFEWRNNFKTVINDMKRLEIIKKYNKKEKRIQIDKNTSEEEVKEIKYILNNMLRYMEQIENKISSEEIAASVEN